MSRLCPACEEGEVSEFLDIGDMPMRVGVQYTTADAARSCARGRIRLARCPNCEFVMNAAFAPESMEYGPSYDNDLGGSAVYRAYERSVAERLIRRYDLNGRRIIEIGCGSGSFLENLCDLGQNSGIGFDPGLDEARLPRHDRVRFVRDFYPGTRTQAVEADLVACRQVFEHVADPLAFLKTLGASLGKSSILYFEVPNFREVLESGALWTIIYEHCSYFTPESLSRVFSRAGFRVLHCEESYNGTFTSVEATLADGAGEPAQFHGVGNGVSIETLARRARSQLAAWRQRVDEFVQAGRRVVLWGAGARAVCFLNALGITSEIGQVVDVNPRKRGKFLGGGGQQIIAPADLLEIRPDVVILTNSIYREEIGLCLEELGLHPELLCA